MIPRTIFSTEHELFRDTMRRFVADEVLPHYADWEAAGRVPRDVWLAAGKVGLSCPAVPESDGGPGGDFLHGAVVTEEMAPARAVAPTFYLQLFGGWGYMTEFPIARAFVDARMTKIGGGSAEVMTHIVGWSLFEGANR